MDRSIEISFSGLCLFVPVMENGLHQMTVLLPQTPMDPTGQYPHVPPHDVRVAYLGGTVTPVMRQVSFPNVPHKNIPPGSFKGVVDLTPIHGKKVKSSELGGSPTDLRARVCLPAGKFVKPGKTVKWKIGNSPHQEMTDVVVWEIPNLTANQLVMHVTDFSNHTVHQKVVLQPGHDGVARITLEHHCGCGGSTINCVTPHFRAYHRLLDNPGNLPLPILEEDCPPDHFALAPASFIDEYPYPLSTYEDDNDKTSLYTCMVAGAQPGP